MNETLLHTSSSPHVRSSKTTRSVMLDVIIAMMPAALFSIYRFRWNAIMVLVLSTACAVAGEYLFNLATRKKQTVGDLSAVVTGILLALCLSPFVPWYIPVLGSLFAVIVAKCAFGGLGQNFMNPALAGRCFLLISFTGIMSSYAPVDAVTSATPLELVRNGAAVNISDVLFGFTNGAMCLSAVAVVLGGIYLLVRGIITWHIPVSYIATFIVMMGLTGGRGFNPAYLLVELCAGGVLLAAFFMATDPVSNPMTPRGQIIFGILIGVLTAIFRVKGSSADSVSYAVILGNLVVPLIDRLPIAQPFGIGSGKPKTGFPKAAIALCVITLIAGAALGAVHFITADKIAEQEEIAANQSYLEVVPSASEVSTEGAIAEIVDGLEAGNYADGKYGRITVNKALVGYDENGEIAGYAISVTSGNAFDGTLTVSVGIAPDGTILGISFTELNETAGMGMEVDKASWKEQFAGRNVSAFTLNKNGGSTAPEEIDSVSGASTTSGAVVNAVNAAIDFYTTNIAK